MKIFVAGTRGIPNILGGVETHCEALFPILQQDEVDITIARRSVYVTQNNKISEYKGVHLVDIYSPKKKSVEAIIHTLIAIFHAKIKGFKYIHIHAIGPSLVIPIARILGLKVVMTHHGPDYDRQKWGKVAKFMLKAGEWCAAKFANEIIVISETINRILEEKYKRHDAHLIYNGVNIPQKAASTSYIDELGLEKGNYVIAVGRFVPEKGFHDLIDAYLKSGISEQLVLVGDADHESKYSKELKEYANKSGVVLTGFIKGQKLNEVFSYAKLFVMPSYHEGLPIALLEAMSYNLNLLVSDIPANLEIKLEEKFYFKCGDVNMLSSRLKSRLSDLSKTDFTELLNKKYNWNYIAYQTIDVYKLLEDGKKTY